MICDIDKAINRYIFFGNGGANLHTKFSETHQITLRTVFFVFFDPQNMDVDTIIISLSVILTEL